MDSYKSGYVMVFYPWKKNPGTDDVRMPPHVEQMKENGTIPLVIVTDPTTTRRLDAFSAKTRKGDAIKKQARDLRRRIKADPTLLLPEGHSTETVAARESDSTSETSHYLTEERLWTNAEGRSITAALVSADAKNAVFEIDGKQVAYPLIKLSSASRADIAGLSD